MADKKSVFIAAMSGVTDSPMLVYKENALVGHIDNKSRSADCDSRMVDIDFVQIN